MIANIEDIRTYCLSKKGVTEGLPFGEGVLVFKVMSKVFALISLEGDHSINLKCDPEQAVTLRESYNFVIPGFHMNKKHWNTILLTEEVSADWVNSWIDHSYELVVKKLKKSEQKLLNSVE